MAAMHFVFITKAKIQFNQLLSVNHNNKKYNQSASILFIFVVLLCGVWHIFLLKRGKKPLWTVFVHVYFFRNIWTKLYTGSSKCLRPDIYYKMHELERKVIKSYTRYDSDVLWLVWF